MSLRIWWGAEGAVWIPPSAAMALCSAEFALLLAGAPRVGGTVLCCATTHSAPSTHIE